MRTTTFLLVCVLPQLAFVPSVRGQLVQIREEFSRDPGASPNSVARLPFDYHMLAGMVAPRGLFVIENKSMEWLGNLSTYG